jgi:xylose isomerase
MITDPRFPRGLTLPPGSSVVSLTFPDGMLAVKVGLVLDGKQYYLLCSREGVSTGNLLTLDEVKERTRLGTA